MPSVGEVDTLRALCHPFYDRDSEAALWRGLLPPYDVEPDDEPDDVGGTWVHPTHAGGASC